MHSDADFFAVFRPSRRALIGAGLLLFFDGWIAGQGILSLLVLLLGTPILLLRAWWARRNRQVMLRRLASAMTLGLAGLVAVLMVRADGRGARERAESLVTACESFRAAKGRYPNALEDLVPTYLPAIPRARQRGGLTDTSFRYFTTGPNEFVRATNVHVLVYPSSPPFGRRFYVFEERRWGFYD